MRDEDRNVADDLDFALTGVIAQPVPLPPEEELLKFLKLNLAAEIAIGGRQSIRVAVTQRRLPLDPALSVVDLIAM